MRPKGVMTIQESNITVLRNNNQNRAVVFLHGFTGSRDDTWDRFPGLLGSSTPDWDIFTVGYATTLQPDVVGIWSADPDLPILSKMLSTELQMPPFNQYKSLALIAHSMGGLVVQKALVDDLDLAKKVQHVILFGTPSAGLRKAAWMFFWKRQLKNMAQGSIFINDLRARWNSCYGSKPPFNLLVIAGASDQFVPPSSSLEPFDVHFQRVVVGNHLSIVKPADPSAPSVILVGATLGTGTTPASEPAAQLRLASERSTAKVPELVQAIEAGTDDMSVKMIVDGALALERAGQRAEAIALLDRYKERDTDIKGTLGGRMKRLWLETEQAEQAERALALYQEALNAAKTPDQIYYLAINVAFMKFAFANDISSAQSMAKVALQHAAPPGDDVWKTATAAEAYLYLDRIPEALAEYRRLVTIETEAWKQGSTSLQASRIAAKLGNRELAEELEVIFTPGAGRVNRIFVSYSHKDRDWIERLKVMIAPYLRAAESELDLWEDTQLEAGQQWDVKIQSALESAGVALALVSADFLASPYVMEKELPALIKAADEGGLRLLWVYISAAGWEETQVSHFQATHDTKTPLDSRPVSEQEEILKSVARQVKEVALAATRRFRNQPLDTISSVVASDWPQ
jgi:pimeloyl-ACP methyl ester carboxylesterase/tetratricopeptide (TPR) repeat protein